MLIYTGSRLETVAVYFAKSRHLNFACRECKRIKWKGNQVPIAQRVLKLRVITVPKTAFYTVLLCSLLGILVCLMFLYFNLHFRGVKTVKLSSPRLNNIAVLGCIVVYVAVILLGLDQATIISEQYFPHLCSVSIPNN